MASSRRQGAIRRQPLSSVAPDRTPGVLGKYDGGDPNILSSFGDTPGPLGFRDYAAPEPRACFADILMSSASNVYVASPVGHSMVSNANSSPTYLIPNPASKSPPLLSDADLEEAAQDLGVEVAAIAAVAKVESGGRSGFDAKGRPKILFEAKWFHKFTGGKYDKSHPRLSQAGWAGARKYYVDDQWTRLNDAFVLEPEAALKSASWGKFQIMGFNHSGFSSVFKFTDAMFISEAQHLKSFLAFCRKKGLVKHLKSKDWANFARGYNGEGYAKNQYDQKLNKAYNDYKKKHEPAKDSVLNLPPAR